MKILFLLAMALILFGCGNNATEKRSLNNDSVTSFSLENTEMHVTAIKGVITKLWDEAYPNRDTTLLRTLYHEKFTLVDDEGVTYTKGEELAYVAEYGNQYENFSYTIDNVCLYENGTAVASASCTFTGTDGEGAFSTEYTQSLTLSTINNDWVIIYSQVSGVEETRYEAAPTE